MAVELTTWITVVVCVANTVDTIVVVPVLTDVRVTGDVFVAVRGLVIAEYRAVVAVTVRVDVGVGMDKQLHALEMADGTS